VLLAEGGGHASHTVSFKSSRERIDDDDDDDDELHEIFLSCEAIVNFKKGEEVGANVSDLKIGLSQDTY
jgi:hypothetical protein